MLKFATTPGNAAEVEKWSDDQVKEWFESSAWGAGLPCAPDKTVDLRKMAMQCALNPGAWEKAFDFLKNTDLKTAATGKYQLDDNGTFATVSDYTSKEKSRFETHQKYIDIQYVPAGREYIDLTSSEPMGDITPYDPEKDIDFFEAAEFTSHLADAEHYFVFFPGEAHRPCMKIDNPSEVRKIVVKIPFV